jgi:hypothetical protein
MAAFAPGAALHVAGTPAARQMLFHRPCAEKSPWTAGSNKKPTSSEATVSTTSHTRLRRNQALAQEYMPGSCSFITGSRSG